MAENIEKSNSNEVKFEQIKKLLDKGGSLKDGITDDKGEKQIYMNQDKIIGLDDIYDLKIIAKTIIGDINVKVEDISINENQVHIKTDKGNGDISKDSFLKVIKGRLEKGSYSVDIDNKHIEFQRIGKIEKITNNTSSEKLEIKSMEDFKNATGIEKIDGVDFKAFSTTKEELEKFKNEIKGTVPEREKIEKIKAFLKEKAKLELTGEKAREKLKSSINTIGDKLPAGSEKVKEELNKMGEEVNKIGSKEGIEKAIGEGLKSTVTGVKEIVSNFFEFLSDLPIIGGFFKALGEMMGFSKKTEEIKEKIGEKINTRGNNIEKINNVLKTKKEDFTLKLQKSIPESLGKKFNIDFSKDPIKLQKLQDLIAKSYGNWDQEKVDKLADKIKDPTKEGLFVEDSFSTIQEILMTSSFFILGLVRDEIVPINLIGIDFIKGGFETIAITINTIGGELGLQNIITLEGFAKNLEGLPPEEKAKTMAIIYRQGGLFFSIMGAIGWGGYKLINAALTDTAANGFKVMPRALLNDYPKLIKDFENIEKALGIEASKSSTPMLIEALENTKKIHMNYGLLEVLEKSGYKKEEFLKLIKQYPELEKKFPDLIEEIIHIPAGSKEAEILGQKVSNKIQTITLDKQWTIKGIAGSFINNQEGRILNYNEHLNNVSEMQKRLALESKGGFKQLGKIGEAIHTAEVSRSGDRLVYSFKDEVSLKTWLKELNQAGPDIIKGVLGKLPIIALAGTTLSSDNMFETLKDEFWYLIPFVGPIMMISKMGIDKDGNFVGLTDASMGAALFAMDGYHIAKGGLKSIIPYVGKPVTDMYEILRGSARFSYTTGKLVGKGVNYVGEKLMIEAEEASIKLAKLGVTPKMKYAFAAAMVAMVGYVAYKEYTDKPLSESDIKNALTSNSIDKEEKEKATIALIQNSLEKFGFSNILVKLNGTTIEISKEQLASVKKIENTFVFDTIKETLEKQNINGYNIKLV